MLFHRLPDDFSGSPEEIALLKERLLSRELYHRAMVSDDFKSTQIVVNLNSFVNGSDDSTDSKRAEYYEVKAILDSMDLSGIEVYVSGMPAVSSPDKRQYEC